MASIRSPNPISQPYYPISSLPAEESSSFVDLHALQKTYKVRASTLLNQFKDEVIAGLSRLEPMVLCSKSKRLSYSALILRCLDRPGASIDNYTVGLKKRLS